jgi:mannose-1-phosphate guanylyltransferase
MQKAVNHRHRWGVILAGGDGVRLRSLTRLVSGDERPKQYCPLLGGKTLLSRTKQRVARSVSDERTLFVLLNSHEPFYKKELGSVPHGRMVVQPCNRGTLPAILCSLMLIRQLDKDAVAGIFPSDHHYTEEERFLAGIDVAFEAAEAHPSVILMGAAAKHAAADYGWIEAEAAVSSRRVAGILRVKRFWEKPSQEVARDLLDRGCIWNTFVMLGRVQAFLDVIQSAAPDLYQAFEPLWQRDPVEYGEAMDSIYAGIAPADFSRLVLSGPQADRLGVFSLGDVGWTDLGDPRRVMTVLDQTVAKREWSSWAVNAMPEAS